MASVFQKCKKADPPCNQRKCGHPWTVRYREPGGRAARQREKSFPRKREADAFAVKVENDKNEGVYRDPSRGAITVRAWAEQWLDNRVLSPKTRKSYRMFLDHYLIPYLGRKTLAGVSNSDVQGFVSAMHKGTIGKQAQAPSTIKARMSILGAMFNDAIKDKRITDNPCRGVTLPRVADQRVDKDAIPTSEQVAEIARVLPDRFRFAVWLMAGCGLRVSEAMAITEDCFRGDTLRIQWQTAEIEDESGKPLGIGFAPLKFRAEGDYREIPIAPFLSDMAEEHIKEHGTRTINGYKGLLFPSDTGRIMSGNNFRNYWARSVQNPEMLGLDFTPHSLRHYFASTALHNGVAINEVSEWLGHRSIQVTVDTYGHLVPAAPDRVREAMQAALNPNRLALTA